MSNPLYDALQSHVKTAPSQSKESLRNAVEKAWMYARTKTIEGNGLSLDILMASIINLDVRVRQRLIADREFNALYSMATAMQGNANTFWAADVRNQVLHTRLVEARGGLQTYGWD